MKKDVLAYLHSHWDREWYKTFEQYRIRLCDVLEDIFAKIENNEINSFYLDGQTIAIDDYLEIHPEKTSYIIDLIKNKKLYIGPHYVLTDEFLVCGESLLRNLQIGVAEALKFNSDIQDFIGYLPDAFGHNAWMPMVLSKANIKNAVVWRGVNPSIQEFYWHSPDNQKIKTIYLPCGYYQDFLAKKTYKTNLINLLKSINNYTIENIPLLLPIGADHLACEDNIKAKIKNFNRNNDLFNLKLSSLSEYMKKAKQYIPNKAINGELRDNSNSYILPSVLSSRIYLKQANVNAQWKLIKIAEPLTSIATFEKIIKSKKENISYAWKKLLQNQAHDSICGCCVDATHRENMERFKTINQVCDTLIDNIKAKLSNKISKSEIGIVNLSNFQYSGVYSFYSDKKLNLPIISKKKAFPIEISQNIHDIPVQENYHYYYEYLAEVEKLQPFSINCIKPTYTISNKFSITTNSIENEFLKFQITQDGSLTIENKFTNKVVNNIFKIIDEADVGDSYNFACIENDIPLVATFKKSSIIENNPLRKILRGMYELKIPSGVNQKNQRTKKLLKHIFYVDFILCKNSKRLDIKINYENFSKNHILKLNFNLKNSLSEIICEDSFGIIKRKVESNYNYKRHLPKNKYQETFLNTYPFQRFMIANSLTIFTKGLHECEIVKNGFNITLLRCFGEIAKKTICTRTAAAGPPLETPEGQCIGSQTAELAILVDDNVDIAFDEADKFFNPLVIIDGIAAKTILNNTQYFDVPKGFYVYSVSETDKNNEIIVKIFNYHDHQNSICFKNWQIVTEVNLLNQITEKHFDENIVGFNPFELKILKLQK